MIPNAAYKQRDVAEALATAHALIDRWRDSEERGGDARVKDCVQGRTAVSLGEAIAWALLEARGFDIKRLVDALSNCSHQEDADPIATWPSRCMRCLRG